MSTVQLETTKSKEASMAALTLAAAFGTDNFRPMETGYKVTVKELENTHIEQLARLSDKWKLKIKRSGAAVTVLVTERD